MRIDEHFLIGLILLQKFIIYFCTAVYLKLIYVHTQHHLLYMYDILYYFILYWLR